MTKAQINNSITIAPSLGPILGGSLTYAAGWTWIFWFLCIAASLCLLMMIFFLPETSRTVVGNGSCTPPRYLRLPGLASMKHWKADNIKTVPRRRLPNPLRSLTILLRKDNGVIAIACGLLYVVYTCINASLSVLFIDIYGLNQWQAGLIYLPFGLGGTISTLFTGKLMNTAYCRFRTQRGLNVDKVAGDDLDTFPIEKARLCVIWAPMFITTSAVVSFGWVLHYHEVCVNIGNNNMTTDALQHIGIPLCLQFVAGMCMQLDFSVSTPLSYS